MAIGYDLFAFEFVRIQDKEKALEDLLGKLEIIVENPVVDFFPPRKESFDFTNRVAAPFSNALLRLSSSLLKAISHRLKGGRANKDEVGVWELLFELDSTLHVDVKQRNFLLLLNFGDSSLCCAVVVPMNLRSLDKLVIRDHLFEDFLRNEVVVDAVLFVRSDATSCVRDAEGEHIREVVLHILNEGAFSCP